MTRPALALSLAVVTSACGAGGSDPPRAAVSDSAGVRVIHLPPARPSHPWTLQLDTTWRSLAGTEGEIVDVRTLPDGRLVALDRMSPAVIVLGPHGEQLSWIRGSGEGPGEFDPGGLSRILVTDSSAAVPDVNQRRLTEFFFSGGPASTRPFPVGGGYAADWQWGGSGAIAYRLVGAGGDVLVQETSSGVDRTLARVLEASTSREAAGRTLPVEAAAVRTPQATFPDTAPLLAGLLRAPNGDIWVRWAGPVAEMGIEALRVGSADGYGGTEWDVLDETGRLRVSVRFPDAFVPRDFQGRLLYGVRRDALGIARVARVVVPWL